MTTNNNAGISPVDREVRALELARDAGFDTDLPAFFHGTAIALKLIALAQQDELAECIAACEAATDTGNDRGIERDVAVWNKAVAYCVRRLKERSNLEITGRTLAQNEADGA